MQELVGTAYCNDVFPSSQHVVFLNGADVQRCGGKDKREEVGWRKGPRVKVGIIGEEGKEAFKGSLIGKEGQRDENDGIFGGR